MGTARLVNLLVFLGQPDDGNVFETEPGQLAARGIQLALPAVNQDQVGQACPARGLGSRCVSLVRDRQFVEHPPVTTPDRFSHGRKVVLPGHGLQLEPAIATAVRPAISEPHQGGDGERAADVRDVEALDDFRWPGKVQLVGQLGQIAGGIGGDGQGVGQAREPPGLAGGFPQIGDQVAKLGGFLEVELGSGIFHLCFEVAGHLVTLAIQEIAGGKHLHPVLLPGDIADAGSGADLQMGVKAVAIVRFARVQHPAATEIELLAGQSERAPQRARVRERSEIASAMVGLDARENQAGDRVLEVHLEQQEPFVVPETDVVARPKFLDQLAFQEQRLGFTADHVTIEIVNGLHQGAELEIPSLPPGGMEILAYAAAQVTGFTDVDDGAKTVFHQVNPGLMGYLAEFVPDGFGRRHAGQLSSETCRGPEPRRVGEGCPGTAGYPASSGRSMKA